MTLDYDLNLRPTGLRVATADAATRFLRLRHDVEHRELKNQVIKLSEQLKRSERHAKEEVDSLKDALARSKMETAAEKRRVDEYLKQAHDQQERLAFNEKNAQEQAGSYNVELARSMRETQREKHKAERYYKVSREKQALARELEDALNQEKKRREHYEEEARQLQRERDALKKELAQLHRQFDAAMEERAKTREHYEQETRQLQQERDALKKEFDAVMEEHAKKDAALLETREKYEEEARQLQRERDALKKELARLHRQFDAAMEERAKKDALLETRRLELEAAQSYFSSADACSEQDVVRLISNLNAEIFQAVRTISDAFRVTNRPTLDEKGKSLLKALIGSSMTQCLLSFPHRNDTVVLEMALQFAMIAFIERVVSAWDLNIWKRSAFGSVHEKMLRAECQTVTGRWRALARQYAPEREHWKGIIENDLSLVCSSILLVAGGNGSILQSVKESLVVIACMASQLRKMIGEDIVGSNYQVTVGRPGDEFSPDAMEDSCAVKGKPPKTGLRVFCPSELGLRRIEKGDSGAADIHAVTLVRSKVILEDFADELGLGQILRCADKK